MFLLTQPAAQTTDFWGIVFPSYIAAVGGLISALIGGVALFQSLRNKGSVNAIARGLNEQHTLVQSGTAYTRTPGDGASDAVRWTLGHTGKQYTLVNQSAMRTARLTGLESAGADSGVTIVPGQPLPIDVAPRASISFSMEKQLISGDISAVRVVWTEEGRGAESAVLFG